MSIPYYGDFAEDDTINIPFNTFDSNDPSASVTVTDLADADIKVHKDGSITQIVTDGATVVINFDGITGNHMVTIDASAHADYSTGSEYAVRLEGITVDGATLNVWIGAFSIERAGGVIALLKLIQAATITNAAGTDIAADIIAVKSETATIVTDTNEIQGKLPTNKFMGSSDGADDDGNINSILTDTGTTLENRQVTIAADVANIDGAAMTGTDNAALASVLGAAVGASISADIAEVKAETATIVTDTNEVQGKLPTNKFMGSSDGADDDGNINSILTDTGTTIPGTITTMQNDLDTITGASGVLIDTDAVDADAIKTDAVDLIWANAMSDLATGAPSATASVLTAINYLYEAWRNKTTTTATLITVTKDDGSTGLVKSTISDDATTFTKGEFVSGV